MRTFGLQPACHRPAAGHPPLAPGLTMIQLVSFPLVCHKNTSPLTPGLLGDTSVQGRGESGGAAEMGGAHLSTSGFRLFQSTASSRQPAGLPLPLSLWTPAAQRRSQYSSGLCQEPAPKQDVPAAPSLSAPLDSRRSQSSQHFPCPRDLAGWRSLSPRCPCRPPGCAVLPLSGNLDAF